MSKIRLVYLYFMFLFFVSIGYFIENPLKNIGFYTKANKYFGVILVPIFIFLFCYGLIFFIKDKKKSLILEIKLYLTLILVVLVFYTFIIYNSGLNFFSVENIKSTVVDNTYCENLLRISIYKYKIGYIPTYLLWLIITLKYKFINIFLFLIVIQIVLLLLIVFNPIRIYLKNKISERRERKRLEAEEKQLLEQIKLKEYLEKKESMKKIKFQENKERILEEKVEIFRKNQKLKKMINLNEDMEDY